MNAIAGLHTHKPRRIYHIKHVHFTPCCGSSAILFNHMRSTSPTIRNVVFYLYASVWNFNYKDEIILICSTLPQYA